jgi:hypothetical protein
MGRRGGLSGIQRMAGRNRLRGARPIGGGPGGGGGGDAWIWVVVIIVFLLSKCTG